MSTNLLSGILFIFIGLCFTIGSTNYAIINSDQIGPGYMPYYLGMILAGIGVIVLLQQAFSKRKEIVGTWHWRPLFFIISGNLIFGLLLAGLGPVPPLGLVVATYGAVILVSNASGKINWIESIQLATVLAIASYLIFVVLLKLSIQVWPELSWI